MGKGLLKKAAQSPEAAAIRKAIGAGPDEEVGVTTPQFEREPGYPVPALPPADLAAYAALTTLDAKALLKLGLRPWGEPEEGDPPLEGCLWVFPGEWYTKIPRGLPVVDIFFCEEEFEPGVTDNGIRLGCLGFGIMGPKLPAKAGG